MNYKIPKLTAKFMLIVILYAIIIVSALHGVQAQSELQNASNETTINKNKNNDNTYNYLQLFANLLENRIHNIAATLEITSTLPEVRSVVYANMVNDTLNGIPENTDLPKRKIAQEILSHFKDFSAVAFVLPNGDAYMLEPFSRQQNLSTPNLGFHDYFKGAISTHNPYLVDVFVSASSRRDTAAIAVPIYSENRNEFSLIGVWVGALNLEVYNELVQSLNLSATSKGENNSNNERIVITDSSGIKIADSDKGQISSISNKSIDLSYSTLQSFKNAVSGQSGSLIEAINGTKVMIHYEPVDAIQTRWVTLLMRPDPDQ